MEPVAGMPAARSAADLRTRLLRSRSRLVRIVEDLEALQVEFYAIGFDAGSDFTKIEALVVRALWSGLSVAVMGLRVVRDEFCRRVEGE